MRPARRPPARFARSAGPALVALAAVLLAPVAAAQAGVVVGEPADRTAELAVGEAETFRFDLRNLHPSNPAHVQVRTQAAPGWSVAPGARTLLLAPDEAGANATEVLVVVRAEARDYERGTARVEFAITTAAGESTIARTIRLVPAEPHVLGRFANPLPAPLDGAYGVFLLNLGIFALAGAAVIAVQEPILRRLAEHANRPLLGLALKRLRLPVMVLVTFLGLAYSLSVLPPSAFADVTLRILDVGIGVLTLYLGYKVLDSALTYYSLKVASRAGSRINDVVLPLTRKVLLVFVILAAIVATLRALAIDPTVFVAGGVLASLVLAFAAQDTLSNLFSGLHLMLDRPFREGEMIQLETGEVCRVEHVGLRSTRLYHPRNHEVMILPNNTLSNSRVVNLMGPDRHYRVAIDVGVAYGTDPDRVRAVLLRVANDHPKVYRAEGFEPIVLFMAFGESSLNFTLRFTVDDLDDRFVVASEVRAAIARAFREHGIEIPFPQRDLWVREHAARAAPAASGADRVDDAAER